MGTSVMIVEAELHIDPDHEDYFWTDVLVPLKEKVKGWGNYGGHVHGDDFLNSRGPDEALKAWGLALVRQYEGGPIISIKGDGLDKWGAHEALFLALAPVASAGDFITILSDNNNVWTYNYDGKGEAGGVTEDHAGPDEHEWEFDKDTSTCCDGVDRCGECRRCGYGEGEEDQAETDQPGIEHPGHQDYGRYV
jgi:hypothetical protein